MLYISIATILIYISKRVYVLYHKSMNIAWIDIFKCKVLYQKKV